jgi:hypothetical protein
LVYFFIRHKVHRIPGAYSYYSLFEWGLVLIDVAFDAVGAGDVSRLQVCLLERWNAVVKLTRFLLNV